VSVGTVTELAPGATPTVDNSGTTNAAILDFGLPGTPTVSVGDVTTLAPGADPTVTNGGTSTAIELDFGLPTTPTISIGTVTTVGPGDPATVTNAGTAAAIVLDFDIPQGVPGVDGEMSGPATSTDNAVPRFDGTDGATLQNSGVIIDDSNNITGVAAITATSVRPTSIDLGQNSDTTIARSGPGDATIEGNAIYRAGGTDVPVADGGTGASTASDARTNLGAASTSQADFISGIIKTGANQDFRIIERLPSNITVTQWWAKTSSGTITLTLKNGTTTMGSSTINASSTPSNANPSSDNTVSGGNVLQINGASNSSAVDISFVIYFTRTLS